MSSGILDGNFAIRPAIKRKIFISYHHGGDQSYYDSFSDTFSATYDVIYDNSLERRIDSDDTDYVIRRIRENHITGSSCTIVLVGLETPQRKYIDWEIQATLEKEHGLIGVQLPTAFVSPQNRVTVPSRLNDNINSGYALWLHWNTIIASSSQLAQYIEAANARDKNLILNSRERRLSNG